MNAWNKLASSLLAVTLLLTGCSGGQKTTPSSTEQTQSRPPLQVPARFTSNKEKLEFAVNAVQNRYYTEAKPLLEQLVSEVPDADVYGRLGSVNYMTGDYTQAIDAWAKAAELDPSKTAQMKNNMANALRDTRKFAEAEAAYREALQVEPTYWTAAVNLGLMLKDQGKSQEALEVLEAAVHANPNEPELASVVHSLKANL